LSDDEYSITKDFQEMALQIADELELDELVASRLLLDAEPDERLLGRPRRECAVLRFHQQRQYLLSCVRLLLELTKIETLPEEIEDWLGSYVTDLILGGGPSQSCHQLVKRVITYMQDIRLWVDRITEQVSNAAVLGYAEQPEFKETTGFSRNSLIQQHELLAVILCHGIDRRVATREDFTTFLSSLKQVVKYDYVAGELECCFGQPRAHLT
jgi:nuclear pore complex protein Nup205